MDRDAIEQDHTVRFLKQTKNTLVGHPTAKVAFYHEGQIPLIVGYINQNEQSQEWSEGRTEAANIIAALAHGPKVVLRGLVSSSALEALLSAVATLGSNESSTLRLSLLRALRSLGSALAETVGPPLWGLEDDLSDLRQEAGAAVDYLFQDASMDVYLPTLSESNSQSKITVCQLISSCARLPKYRNAVVGWLPPDERSKQTKGKRGWEDPVLTSIETSHKHGGWALRHLTEILRCKDLKLQAASLAAIATLVKDNASVASWLARSSPDGEHSTILSICLSFTKARNIEVRLAACQCVTNIIKREQAGRVAQYSFESGVVLHVLTQVISNELELPHNRSRACFILSHLVADDVQCGENALASGTLAIVADLIKAITPTERPIEWDDGEPISVLRLREAALMSVAALSLYRNDARDKVTNMYGLLPYVTLCLTHPHVGVRYAACHCIRSLSRAVSVLRTSIVDSGVCDIMCKIIEDVHEDRRVTTAALAGFCNLLLNFSPLRKTMLDNRLMQRIATLAMSSDHSLRLNAVWTIRNSTYKATFDESKHIMAQVGWDNLLYFTRDPHDDVREQAFAAMCNISSTDRGVKEIFNAFHVPGEGFLDILTEAASSTNDEILCSVMGMFGNIANGGYENRLITHRGIVSILHTGIEHPKQGICRAALKCIETLAEGRYPELREEGIDATLRRIARDGSSASGGHRDASADAEIRRIAKHALHKLDSPGPADYSDMGPYH